MENDFLASRLNQPVVVFRGHTRGEMILISLVSWVTVAIVMGSFFLLLCHQPLVGIGISFPLAIPVGWVSATFLHKYKADKPPGYLKQRWLLALAKKGVRQSPFVQRSGAWSVRRWQ